jgi:hypothetical protein
MATGSAAPITAAREMRRRWCVKKDVVAVARARRVCELKTGPHSTAALMRARPRGARLHDYWQQASKRGAAKEVGFPGFRPDGDGERRADHGGERDEAQVVREEGGGGRARRAVVLKVVSGDDARVSQSSKKILPHPRWNTGREASEINRPRENSARATR